MPQAFFWQPFCIYNFKIILSLTDCRHLKDETYFYMKTAHIIPMLFLLFITQFSAQEINQFDENGKRHGIWKKNFDDTQVLRYEGEFFHDKEIGVFKFYKNVKKQAVLSATKTFNQDNNLVDVKFFTSKGKLVSEGQMNGKIFIGTWKYYQKNNNGLLTLEHYDNYGVLQGERFVYYENGHLAEKQFYKDGKLEGISLWYSEKDVVLKEFIYEGGELHGMSRYYNPKGELIVEGQYKRGKKHGVWKFYENDLLVKEENFSYISKIKKK